MSKTIAVIMADGVADWEIGPILPSAREWFGDTIVVASLDGNTVTSIGGLRIQPDHAFADLSPVDADLWLLPGSDRWQEAENVSLSDALRARNVAGRPIAAICGATLALAHAGLLDVRTHTSNSLEFLTTHAGGYAGTSFYKDAHAISDDGIVTAPGTSPVTFAVECLRLLHPDKEELIGQMRAMFAGEFKEA